MRVNLTDVNRATVSLNQAASLLSLHGETGYSFTASFMCGGLLKCCKQGIELVKRRLLRDLNTRQDG